MAINKTTINSASINSSYTYNGEGGELYPIPVNIIMSANANGFLARRYLVVGEIVRQRMTTISLLVIKKPLKNNGSIVSSRITYTGLGRKFSLSPTQAISKTEVVTRVKMFTKMLIERVFSNLNIDNKGLLASKKSFDSSISFNNTAGIATLSIKKILDVNNTIINTNAYVKLAGRFVIQGNTKLGIEINPTKLLSSRKINPTSLNTHVSAELGTYSPLNPKNVVINISLSNKIYAILYDSAPPERRMIIEEDYRYISIPEEIKIMNVFKKQPADSYDYDFSYVEWLMGQDRVNSVVVSTFPDDNTDPDGLQVEIRNLLSPNLKLWISGGKNGVTYKCTITATTDENRIKQSEFKLKIKDI